MNRPLTWLAVAWAAGTAIGSRLPAGVLSWRMAAIAAALAMMAALLAVPFRRAVGCALLLVAAASYYQGYDARNVSSIVPPSAETEQWDAVLTGTIASAVTVDGDRVAFAMRAARIRTNGTDAGEEIDERVQVSIRLLKREEQDAAKHWGRGDAIKLAGTLKPPGAARNFGGFDYRLYLYRNHIHWQLSAKGTDAVRVGEEAGSDGQAGDAPGASAAQRALRWNDDLRSRLGGVFDRLFPEGADAGYLKSLVLGLTDDMDPDLYRQFSLLGLTHILAISGLHVAVFVAGCLWLLRLFGLTREKTLTVALALVPFYIALSGGSPSAVRAGLMAMIGLYAARRGIWKDALNVIGLAAVLMLLWDPYYLHDVSFQLSFLVTLGLILGVPRFSKLLPVRPAALNSAISVTVVAQLISFPVTVYYFNGISLLSGFANFLLVPFVSFVVLPLGTIALLAGAVSTPAGGAIGWLVVRLNDATFRIVGTGAEHDPLRLVWPKPALWWVAAFYAALALAFAGAAAWRERGKPAVAVSAVAALLVLLAYGYDPDVRSRDGRVHVLDVGQGDAILIRTPQGRHVLVDGGGTVTFRKPGDEWKERRDPYEVGGKLLVPLLKQRGVHRLDLVVATHQDQDHIGGLQAVVEQIPVRAVAMNGTWKGNDSSRKLFETAMRRGADIVTLPEGGRIPVDRHTELTVLDAGGPGPDEPLRIEEEQNGESVVLLMRMRETTFLFTGDMDAKREGELLAALKRNGAAPPPSVDVLKVAHHGSKTSTTDEWLAYWRPRLSVVSVGLNNAYGHPNPGVLERLARSGGETYRTDRDGEIVFTVTEDGVKVETKL
ncbi:DNA internalization-related competence protein ComEC/Rec2 [Paenibacillus flagellatus]|uniref:DNA internalization-related competence protein ComEC/Rec2 n=1 Tax=Paenibacillus flagellatus TaxID=2211139 RepID=A0A2V5KSA1_9BACL|nr:DNA internalization-related competence protein ComEC/Rec2 [Paenibacillus flagellatus]PYI51876.1 DNA internalization-related competence protein ComEC/Rec2 [Paenibacillus flagellatus]